MHVRTRVRGVTLPVAACACSLILMLNSASAGASAASPTVTPATGGGGVAVVPGFTQFDPAVVGYERSEVFLSGMANAYAADRAARHRWEVQRRGDEHGAVHDPRRRDATHRPTPFQRNGRRRVAERLAEGPTPARTGSSPTTS